jgi:hypothetical protein
MPKYKQVNNELIEITGSELAALEAKEQAWEDGALDRALEGLRHKRNRLLAETDYYALSDVTMSDDMKTYRQNLRDITEGKDTVEKCENATWPTKP